MLICHHCGHHNQPDAVVCEGCANILALTCATCFETVPLSSKFCNHCGAPISLPEALTPRETTNRKTLIVPIAALMPQQLEEKIDAVTATLRDERRMVTILNLQLGGGLQAEAAHEQEEVYLLLDQLLQSLVEIIYEYEGHLDFLANDGLQALFGAPVAHENDAERALRAALDIWARVQQYEPDWQKLGKPLQARLGVHTGNVTIGKVSERWMMDYTIVGNAVKIAQNLGSTASWGEIWVSDVTYRQTRSLFYFRPVDAASAEGVFSGAYVLQGLQRRLGSGQGLFGIPAPLIGRQEMLDAIVTLFAQVRRREKPGAVLLSGEAGVGKSRLVEEARSAILRREGGKTAVYQGYSLSYARSRPYWAIIDLLRNIIGVSEREPLATQFTNLRRHLQQINLWQEDVWPYLAHLLGIRYQDDGQEVPVRVTDASMLQRLTYVALRRLILVEVANSPTVLIFEDLHWIDTASWEFLRHLILSIGKGPLLLLLVARDEINGKLETLQGMVQQTDLPFVHVALPSLKPDEGLRLVDELLQPGSLALAPLKAKVAQLAGGNPFFTEEIIRTLIEEEGVVKGNGMWQPAAQATSLLMHVPVTLKGLILARVDRLASPVRETLQKAAVLGLEFTTALLSWIHPAGEDAIEEDLEELVERGFLLPQSIGGEQGFAFRHALVQEVVYETLLQQERQQLHAQAAQAIEADVNWAEDEKFELLAYHFVRSSHRDRAILYLLEAAERAAKRYANETAVHHYRQVLTMINAKPTTYSSSYFRARIGLGQSLKQLGEYQEAREILSDSLQSFLHWSIIAESSDLLPLLVNGLRELADTYVREGAYDVAISHLEAGIEALGDDGRNRYVDIWLSLVERLAFAHMRQGKLDSAFALAHMGTTEIDLHQTRNLLAVADLYNTLGGIAWQQGNLDEAIFYVGQSLEPYGRLGYVGGTANAYSNLGILHAQQGHWQKTLNYWEQALQIRREIGDYYRQAISLANLAQLRLQMGDFDLAQGNLHDAQEIFARLGDAWGLAQVCATQTELALARRDVAQSAQAVARALDLARETGSQELIVHAMSLKSLVLRHQLALADGLELAREAVVVAKTLGQPDVEADSTRILGILFLADGNYQEAETSLRESLELSRQIKDPYRQGLALLELGELYQLLTKNGAPGQQGHFEIARQLMHEAAGLFQKLGAVTHLHRLEEMQGRLEEEFSGNLAAPVTAVSPTAIPLGERRTATILWANLIVPPHASEEAAFATLASAISAISTIVQEHQGIMRQHADGIEAVFGAPIAYEDDPEQAVKAAYYILNHLQQAQHELDLAVKIGIGQGEVIINPASSRHREKLTILATPLQHVRNIATQVPVGRIWVTEPVQRLSKRLFTFQPVATLQALGALWELASLQPVAIPKRGLPNRPSRFVGRAKSLRQMLSLSLNLTRGIGGWFLIEGEAGIGKTRLLREFQMAIASPGRLVWWGSCSAQGMNQPFHLITDLLNNVFGLQLTDSTEMIRGKMANVMGRWPQEAHDTLPYLEILLGLPPSESGENRLIALEPDQLRQQIFVAVRRLMKALAKRVSIVLIFDDLHWVDPVSAELLFFLAPLITSDSILFAGAQRRQGADVPNDRLIRLQGLLPGQTMHLLLPRLSVADSFTLIQDLFATSDLPSDVSNLILERSEGNPYFIEEYVRMFIENGYVEFVNGRWQINPELDLKVVKLPSSLEALIRSRLDALPPELKEILQYAAVIGRTFDAELLATLINNPQLKADLRRLASRLMIVAVNGSSLWQFSHGLFESIVYASMLKKHRQQLHRRIAELLEQDRQEGVDDWTAELAYHFFQAGTPEQAVPYLLQNAEQAAARYANEEALSQYQQAAAIVHTHNISNPQYRWRLATGLGSVYRLRAQFDDSIRALKEIFPLMEAGAFDREQAADVLWELGQTLRFQGEFVQAEKFYQEALLHLGALDTDGVKAKAARIFLGIAWTYWSQGDLLNSQQACKNSLELAQELNSIGDRAAVENLLGGIYFRQGDWRSALHHTTRAMILREQMGYSWGVAATLSNLGILAVVAGHWHKAESFFKRSIVLRQEIGDIEGVVIAQNNLGNLLRDQGDLEEAESYLRESLQIANMFNMRHHLAATYDGLAEVLHLQNRLEEAEVMVDAGMREAERMGAQELLAYIYRIQAEIFLAKGFYKEGKAAALQATKQAAALNNRSYGAAAWRIAAESCLLEQEFDLAREYLERSTMLLAETTDELGVALVKTLSARLHLALGQREEAEESLRSARNVFSRLGAKFYLRRLDEVFLLLAR